VDEAVEAVAEAVGEVFENLLAITEIGSDLDEQDKEEAQPVAVAVIASQVASIAASAASAARTTGGGGGGASQSSSSRKGTRRV
jgi:hypothetical protein